MKSVGHWGNDTDRGNERETCPTATLCTTNLKWTNLGKWEGNQPHCHFMYNKSQMD